MKILRTRSSRTLLFLACVCSAIGCKFPQNEYEPPPPPDVTVTHPVQLPITPFLEQNGVTEAVEEVEVRSRVRGFVQSVEFKPGDEVAKDDVLYRIEPDQYQAAVNSAQAAVDASKAAISVAKSLVKTAEAEEKRAAQNLAREKALMEQRAGSQADLDAAVAASDGAAAAVKSAEANVEAAIAAKGVSDANLAQAKLDLEYTEVKSPIDGRISATIIKEGNLVENGDQLATVVNRSKVFANFSVSDREMLRFMRSRQSELSPDDVVNPVWWRGWSVYLQREGDVGFPYEGTLDNVDQVGIDASTGTLRLRAQFDNHDNGLVPGLFVSVRVPIEKSVEAILIPEYAVLRDQRGQFVLVVNAERQVERVAVTVADTISGWAVIEEGLSVDSRVVIEGLQRARPGLEVNAKDRQCEIDDQTLMRGFSPSDDPPAVSTDGGTTSPSEAE